VKAIILAAGRGSRMGGATADQPKCLTPLHGRTLLDWQVEALRDAGIESIALVRGYMGEKLPRDARVAAGRAGLPAQVVADMCTVQNSPPRRVAMAW